MNNWQRDSRWGYKYLGFSYTYIKDYGCLISALGNILNITPDVVNEKMKAVKGFAEGNLLIWYKIAEAFPGAKATRYTYYDNNIALASVPNLLVEVSAKAIGGSGKHWVRFIGGGKCQDPWTGTVRPTSDFGTPVGMAVITGVANIPAPTPPGDDILLNKIKAVVDGVGDPRTKIARIREILK